MSTLAFDIIARDRASSTFDHVGDSATRSSGKLKKWAVAGGMAVGAAAVFAGKAMIGMAQAAVEDEKSQAMLAKALTNSTGATKAQKAAVEDWITAQGKALGVADDELRPALARLAQATGSVSKAQRLTSLAMDVSAGTGKSLKTVTEALMKAQNGSLGGLSRLGVATKDAEGKEKSLAAVTKELANLHGGQAAKAAETSAGKMDRLKLMYDETKESIGAKLIPVLETGAEKTLKFVDQWEKGTGAGGRAADIFGQVGDALKSVGRNLDTVAPAIGVVAAGWIAYTTATKIAAVATAIQTAGTVGATGATWSLNAALRANPIGLVVTALTALGVGLVIAHKKSDTFRAIVDTAFSAVKSAGVAMWENGIKPAFSAMKTGFEAVGKAGTWLWNHALQPAFKFIINGVGSILDMWASMLGTLAKVPGFGWAEKAANAMANAADKAHAMAEGIKKIPAKKDVWVAVKYTYSGLRGRGGSGTTRSGDSDDPSTYLPRLAQTVKPMAERVMDAIADGLERGGKKVDKVLAAGRDSIRSRVGAIKDEMASLSSSIASALNPTEFGGGVSELMASLTGNNGALSGLLAVFEKLKGSVSQGFLSALMQSGNTGLATALANDPGAAAQASALFDANASMAGNLGDKTAQAVMGDQIEKALKDEIGKLIHALKDDVPEKQAKKIRNALEGLQLELTGGGRGGGQGAHVRGAW